MGKVNSILSSRFRKKEKPSKKMEALAQNTSLTSFSGVFGVSELDASSQEELRHILERYVDEERDIESDLEALSSITCEVRAISNQAAILHGERIKRAQTILKEYREGAFTAWLMTTYGNRQTPYNFLQYYEFHETMPGDLRPQISAMPRQAVYSLASREGDVQEKQKIVEQYQGETKAELLDLIRDTFPLAETDKRKVTVAEGIISALKKIQSQLAVKGRRLTPSQKEEICDWLDSLKEIVT